MNLSPVTTDGGLAHEDGFHGIACLLVFLQSILQCNLQAGRRSRGIALHAERFCISVKAENEADLEQGGLQSVEEFTE